MKKSLLFTLAMLCSQAQADIVLRDDSQSDVRLAVPAKRIVSLAPNITEVVYAAGAGDRLVGSVDFSDYPAAAKKLPRVGSYARVDVEAIVALKPGEVSQPIRTHFGYHLIQLLERRSAGLTPERRRMQARLALKERKADEAYQEWLRQLRDRTYVEVRLEDK